MLIELHPRKAFVRATGQEILVDDVTFNSEWHSETPLDQAPASDAPDGKGGEGGDEDQE